MTRAKEKVAAAESDCTGARGLSLWSGFGEGSYPVVEYGGHR